MKWIKAIFYISVCMTLGFLVDEAGVKLTWWSWPVCVFWSAYPSIYLGKTIAHSIAEKSDRKIKL